MGFPEAEDSDKRGDVIQGSSLVAGPLGTEWRTRCPLSSNHYKEKRIMRNRSLTTRMRKPILMGGASAFLFGLVGFVAFAPSAFASTTTVTVNEHSVVSGYPAALTPGDTAWYTEDTRTGGASAFTNAYGAPPGLGAGSLQLTTDSTTAAKAQLISDQFVGTPLSDVSALSYWTYAVAGNPATADVSFQLQVNLAGNLSGTSDFTTLVYEPYWNGANGAGVVTNPTQGTWQQWDMTTGVFWSSKTVDGLTAGAGGSPFYTIAQVLGLDPHAVVLGIGANVGTYNPNYTVATDGITFGTSAGTTVFNFEVAPPIATSKNQCKKGGWTLYTDSAGNPFKNQGDCVSYVATEGRNPADG